MPASIVPAHLPPFGNAGARSNLLPGLNLEFSLLLKQLAPCVRVVSVADRAIEDRDIWLGQIFPDRRRLLLRAGELRHLAQSDGGFSLMIVSAEDKARIVAVLRDVRAVFENKLVVPLLSACPPGDRADLLKCGADDVLHLGMAIGEGEARLCALLRRASWAQRDEGPAPRRGAEAQVDWLCSERLNPQERRVLTELHAHLGVVVPHHVLRRAARTTGTLASANLLKVVIFRIRRRLKPQFAIESARGVGFTLNYVRRSERDDARPPFGRALTPIATSVDRADR